MSNSQMPMDELSGKKNLEGTYKVSFEISISLEDDMSISDVAQSLAEGSLQKIAHVDIKKMGIKETPELKIGDVVILNKNIEINATIVEDDGYLVVGLSNEDSKVIAERKLTIPAFSKAVVNQITKEGVELIELDTAVMTPLEDPETCEIIDTPVNVDLFTVPVDVIERAE